MGLADEHTRNTIAARRESSHLGERTKQRLNLLFLPFLRTVRTSLDKGAQKLGEGIRRERNADEAGTLDGPEPSATGLPTLTESAEPKPPKLWPPTANESAR